MRGNPFLLLLIILSFAYLTPLNAQVPKSYILISEILPDASGSDSGKEWIELYNYYNVDFELNGYYFKIESNSGSSKTINLPHIVIPSKQYYVIAEFDFQISNSLNLGSGKLAMYNSASKITLYDSNNNKIDELSYPTPSENATFEKKGATCLEVAVNMLGGSGGAVNTNYDASCFPETLDNPTSYPLPPQEQPKPKNYSIQISEIYPSPNSEEEEWLEIYNAGEESIELSNFSLQKPSTSTKTLLSGSINSKDYRLVAGSELKFALNNSGDEIMLFSNENVKLDSLKYKSTPKGSSIGKKFADSKYIQSTEYAEVTLAPTPLDLNIFPDNTVYKLDSISALKKATLGKLYEFHGFLTADSTTTKGTLFVTDNDSAVKVQSKDGVEYFTGNKLKIVGKLTLQGTDYLISDAIIEYLNENIEPKFNQLQNADDLLKFQFMNVDFAGEVIGSYSTSFDVNFAGKVIRINKLQEIKISKGSKYKIKGVLHKDGSLYRVIATEILPLDESTKSKGAEESLEDDLIPNSSVSKNSQSERRVLDTKIHYLPEGSVLGYSSAPVSVKSNSLMLLIVQIIAALILFLSFIDIKYLNVWKKKLIYWVRNLKLQSLKDYL